MNIIKKNWLVVIAVLVLVISGSLYLYFSNQEKASIDTGFVQGKIAYDNIDNYTDGIMLAKKDDNYLIIDVNDKIIEKIDKDATDIKILYNGYYEYTLAEQVYLNRNGKNIKTFATLLPEEYNLYKDENDETASYITINAKKLAKDVYYSTISSDDSIKTYIYNSKTGKKLYETDNYISLLKTPNQKEYEYFVVGDKELVRISDFKTIFKETDVNIVGDNNRKDVEEDIITNSSKYIVISSLNSADGSLKYGLIDYDGNIIIPISYEDINFKVDNNRFIAAKKEGKYGLINALNEELLAFNSDAIEVYDNNIILVNNKKLGIMNNELELIYNYKSSVSNIEYNSRVCCGNTNAFEVFKPTDELVISIYPKSDEENDGQTFKNTIIVNKKNEIKELKGQTLKYLADDEVIKTNYLLEEKIDDNTLTLNIFDTSGQGLATYETIVNDKINSITYNLIDEKYILVEIFDSEYKSLYKAIIEATSGKVLAENEECQNYIKKTTLTNGYYYTGKDNNIIIKDSNDRLVMSIEGKDIIYLNGNYFAVKNKNGKYYICKVILKEEKVK